MSAASHLRIAHFLMAIGLIPIVVASVVSASLVYFPKDGLSGNGGGLIVSMALLMEGYLGTLIIGGIGAMWSWHLTLRPDYVPTTTTSVLRRLVGIALVAPLLLLMPTL